MYKIYLFVIITTIISCQSSQRSVQLDLPKQPNIVWIVAEDLSSYIPPFGDSTIQTPNLSRLAREGVCYDNVYSPSPVCAPSRAAIATGMYPVVIGANHMRTGPWYSEFRDTTKINQYSQDWLPKGISAYEAQPPIGIKMMSEYLREQGYYCINNAKEDYQFRKTITAWDESSRQAHWKNRKEGQPFFAIFNLEVTHESRMWNKADDSLWVDEKLDVPIPPYLPSTAISKNNIRRMYSNIKEMDFQVGQLLKELEDAGELENTIIFWYTDHGGPLPRQKRLLYDSGLKVPMIIRFPSAQLSNTRDNRMISFIDFAPTVLSLANINPVPKMNGKAFLGKFQRQTEPQYIFAAADRFDRLYDRNRAVRDHRYKYIKYYSPEKSMYLDVAYRKNMPIMQELLRLRDEDKLTPQQALWFRPTKPNEELFDTWEDPHELKNLANNPKYANKLTELRTANEQWQKKFTDLGMLTEIALFEQLSPNGNIPTVEKPVIELKENLISLSCSTKGASIGYQLIKLGEKEPTSWNIYTQPFELPQDFQLKVVADKIGYIPSEIVQSSH
jgi:arylsulfatase A-like enzyme